MTLPKVAILGGGVGGMTAAFELSRPGWTSRYSSITVYQRGWRLGGKGASGRNAAEADRIEEHGLHIWFGFYDNAFRIMRECYAELGRGPSSPLPTAQAAFERADQFVVMEDRPEGWLSWLAEFPSDDEFPGEPGATTPTPWEMVLRALELTARMLSSTSAAAPAATIAAYPVPPSGSGSSGGANISATPAPAGLGDLIVDVVDEIRDWALAMAEGTAEGAVLAALTLASALAVEPAAQSPLDHDHLLALLDVASELARLLLPSPSRLSDARRREWYAADVLLAGVRGVLRHNLLTDPQGLDAIDDYEFTDWLIHHGADPESARSALIRTVVYDLQFAYADGDPNQPSCSAAAALRGFIRLLFTYRGSVAWKMRAGMGDAIFAPLYEVLRNRGVTFKFFHRVDALHLDPSGTSIASIDMARQADLATGVAEYDPLVDVGGLPCWPNTPNVNQLMAGGLPSPEEMESIWHTTPDAATFTLHAGTDFDQVVLAIPVGMHPLICSELIAARPQWQRSATRIGTIYTQAFQLWLTKDFDQLGGVRDACLGGYLEPFDTVADMSQTMASESWPAGSVASIAYFCNVLPTDSVDLTVTNVQAEANATVKANAVNFLRRWMTPIWPKGVQRYPTDFKWEYLATPTPDPATGPARFDTQYYRANIDPSERYVLPLPGTVGDRLHPGDSGFSNLYLAGDWTVCGINAGCVEAAVISGMLAANAMCGSPAVRDIIGYEHW